MTFSLRGGLGVEGVEGVTRRAGAGWYVTRTDCYLTFAASPSLVLSSVRTNVFTDLTITPLILIQGHYSLTKEPIRPHPSFLRCIGVVVCYYGEEFRKWKLEWFSSD